ncbi:MAG: hypothetical protein V1793_19655 [Pseudomonadota bacterium]
MPFLSTGAPSGICTIALLRQRHAGSQPCGDVQEGPAASLARDMEQSCIDVRELTGWYCRLVYGTLGSMGAV